MAETVFEPGRMAENPYPVRGEGVGVGVYSYWAVP